MIPAELNEEDVKRVQDLAVLTYRLLECEGMARVDMFMLKDGKLVINEINTIPGFTKISMYPKLWEVSGLSYTDLISHLIEYAIESHGIRNSLKQ
jgi:D-alanine-D-alanine ligase